MIGKTISHYRIVAKLGEGGMGAVYLADDLRLDRRVALKFLPAAMTDDPGVRARFEREAKSAAALDHPNIVTVYEVDEHEGQPFIAMAHVGGGSLRDLIAQDGLPSDRALEIAIALCDALRAAHAAGIVHRDVKPENILFDESGRTLLADFGLATSEGLTRITREGSTVGTLHYMSPEQTRGEDPDARSDIFSLGAILYEMIAGRRAFTGENAAAVLHAVTNEHPQPLSRYANQAPAELERIVTKALSKDVQTRYQSAADLMADLRALRGSAAGLTANPATHTDRAAGSKPARPWRWAWLGFGVIAVLGLGYSLRSVLTPASSSGALAVLPFSNSSPDPDTAYLTAGVTQSLINSLAAFEGLKVISHHTSSRFTDPDVDIRDVGSQLGVSTVLVGRLDSRQDRLVVSVELLNVRDGQQLWGDRFDRTPEDLLTIEEEIVTRVTDRLNARLSDRVSQRLEERQEIDSGAWNLYLRGRYVLQGTGRESHARAREFFRQAIEIEPRFALAFVGLGESYVSEAWLSSAAREEMLPLARAALETALEIDSDLSEVQVLRGDIEMYFDFDWAEAEAAFRRAIEIAPGSDSAHGGYSSYLNLVTRFDEAIEHALIAQELDPLSVTATHTLAYNLLCAGRYEEAIRHFRRAIDLNPNWLWGYIKLGMAYSMRGDHADAQEACARADEILGDDPGSPLSQHWRALIELRAGRPDRMREVLERLEARAEIDYVDPFVVGQIRHDLGDLDGALDLFEEAWAQRSPLCVYLLVNRTTFLADIASHPRYQALVDRMDYPLPPSR